MQLGKQLLSNYINYIRYIIYIKYVRYIRYAIYIRYISYIRYARFVRYVRYIRYTQLLEHLVGRSMLNHFAKMPYSGTQYGSVQVVQIQVSFTN